MPNTTNSSRRRGLFGLAKPEQFTIQPPRSIAPSSAAALRRLSDGKRPRGVRSDWIEDAFAYFETVPEVGYAIGQTAEMVAECAPLRPVIVDDNFKATPTDDPRALRSARSLRGPQGGQRELMRRGGLLMKIAGEMWVYGAEQDGANYWEFLSPLELRVPENPNDAVARNRSGRHGWERIRDAYYARVWISDARFSERAASSLSRCLDTCRELMMLSHMLEAIITTRLPMGILAVPDGMSWQGPLERRDETATPEAGGDFADMAVEEEPDFVDMLQEHLAAPREDLRSAATLVPVVITGNAEDIQAIRVIELAKELDWYSQTLREEIVTRLARGLDVPPEMISGKSGMSHWGAYEVTHDFVSRHVVPLGERIAEALTAVHQALLELEEGMSPEEAARHELRFDPSPILRRADEAGTAMRLWEADLISDDAVLWKQGLDPGEVKATDEERQRRLLVRLLLQSRPQLTPTGLAKLGLDPEDVTYGPAPTGVGGRGPGLGQPQDVGIPVVDSTSGAEEPVKQARSFADSLLVERLLTRCDADRQRALEKAGARVLSKIGRSDENRDLRDITNRVPRKEILEALDRDVLRRRLRLRVEDLLSGAWDDTRVETQRSIRAWLIERAGLPDGQADQTALWAAEQLTSRLHDLTVANLHRQLPVGGHGHQTPEALVVAVIDETLARVGSLQRGSDVLV